MPPPPPVTNRDDSVNWMQVSQVWWVHHLNHWTMEDICQRSISLYCNLSLFASII